MKETTCTNRFGLRGVWAGVLKPVSAKDDPPILHIQPQKLSGGKHQNGRNAGRNEVEDVIRLCRDQTDVLVWGFHVAQHGIHCVYRFIKETERCAADGQGNQRGNDTV